ncbi:hypothetical protein Tco_1310412 [Tanacetum coccineum]
MESCKRRVMISATSLNHDEWDCQTIDNFTYPSLFCVDRDISTRRARSRTYRRLSMTLLSSMDPNVDKKRKINRCPVLSKGVKLCQAEFAHNHAVNRSTGFSPFQVVYSAQPRGPLDLMSLPVSGSVPKKVQYFVEGLREVPKAVRDNFTCCLSRCSSDDDLVVNSRANFVYPGGNDAGLSIEEPSIEERAILFLEAQDRVKKGPLFKRA